MYSIQAPTMLDAMERLTWMAREAREAAGLLPAQAVGLSCQFRDLTHPVELVPTPETSLG
jgi:hypothetical protein